MSKESVFFIENESLYVEKNIVTINIPLLFTCIDDNKQKYLVLCFDDENLHYLIAKTNNHDLIDMLNSSINMREPFKKSQKLWIVESSFDIKDDKVLKVEYKSIPEENLPKKGAYLELKNSSIEKYIRELEREIGIFSEDIIIQKNKYMLFKINSITIPPMSFKEKIRSCFNTEIDFSLPTFAINTKLNKFTQ